MPVKILTVDDSKTARMLITRALEPFDCEVVQASNGEEGLQQIGKGSMPDLVLLDVTMPVMDGVTMLEQLRMDPKFEQLPVIMLTAESGRESVMALSKLGVSDYLAKPFQTEKFLEKVGRIVKLEPKQGATEYEQLAVRFGLEAVPESVLRLTQILASTDASLEMIAEAISQDVVLTKRLLKAANPRFIEKPEYTIDEVKSALGRAGLSFGVLVATCDPLIRAVLKTFQTSLSTQLQQVEANSITAIQGSHVSGYAEFSGRAVGRVQLRFNDRVADFIARRVLGMDPQDRCDASTVDDVIGEIVTMVVGNFKSNLSNAGLECILTPPVVERTGNLDILKVEGGGAERLAFRSARVSMFVDNTVNPWIP